ncbi:hypothetical protein DPMN_035131, partial [Dreissena polymorpha]
MASKATTLKDVLLLHSAKDAGDWTEFIQNEIKTFGLQIKEVDIKDLAASMKDIHILCAQYSVVSLVISEEMLKTIDSVASELSTTLQNHSYVTLIKLFIDDCEKELYSNVLPKYPSAKTWKTFKISDPDAQGKLQATVSSLINMVQDSQMVAKPAPSPSGDMLRTKSSHSTAKPKHSAQITVSPDSIRQGGETVLVVWYRAIPESYLVQVAIGENDDAKKLETKRINEYTFSFTAPSYKAGMTHMYVFMDGKKCLKRMIKYSGMCEFAYTYPEFLCQLIDLDAADHTGLDNYLTTVFQSSTPADWSMANMLTHRNIILPVGSKKSDSELPTLLHFACKYSLNSLASSIIDTPGAHEALEILNCRDKTPYDIAKEMNNEDLIGYIDVFLEMVDYNTQIEDLYTRMKNGQLADYSYTPNKEIGDGYLNRSSPGSFVTDGVAEDDYERTDKTSHQVVVVDENEDINEPTEQAPTVPRRKPSQLRSPEQPSPPVVTRTPSINSGNRVERPIHPPSYNPKAMCMMPDDDAMGGKETGDGYLKMGGSPGSFVYKGRVPEDDYERTDKTSSQAVEVDEDEDIHEPTEQAPPVPRRKSSQLRTPEQTSPPAVNRTPSSYPGNRSERQPAQPIRHPSLGESFNPNMTPDDDPKGGSRDLLSPGSMGSSALNESNEIIESYKLGGIGMDDVDKLYCAWQERNKDSSKSIKEKKQHLESLRSLYEDVGSKKKGGLFSRLTKRKAEKKQVEIEHHVNTGARSNSYRTWDIMKKPSWPHMFSNRESTASNTSTSSSSSDKSQDSAIEMIEEDDIVVRRPRDANTDTEAKRQSWGQRYLAIKQQPRKTATLPKPPPRNPTINQLIQGSRPPARKESPPPVPRRNRDSTGSNTSNSIWEYMKKHSELHPSSDKESTTSDNSTSSSSSVISQDSAISMIEESKPKKPPPLVQPAVSKPGPPKLPDKGPVISAEQSKPEPEKDKKVVKGDTELRAISLEQTTPVDLGNKVN